MIDDTLISSFQINNTGYNELCHKAMADKQTYRRLKDYNIYISFLVNKLNRTIMFYVQGQLAQNGY